MIQILCADISSITEIEYQKLYQRASVLRRQRADRYRSFSDSVRCLMGEVLLRQALTEVYGHWEAFSLSQTEQGKPYVENQPDFHFSISHSGKWVVLAYGSTKIGIDVQKIEVNKRQSAVARRFFTEEEQQYLLTLPDYPQTFAQIWTAKESYLKYLGTGLSKSLTSFSVLSPQDGLHFFWETLEGCCLCLCTHEETYQIRLCDVKNAPA